MSAERLWAPWRLDYIKGPKPDECIFCTSPARGDDAATHIAHRGGRCFVMLNAYPYTNGHLMVAPYRHVSSLEHLDEQESAELSALTRRALGALRGVYGPDGFNVGVNEGKIAGAGFAGHIHVHVVPRWEADSNFMAVTADTRVLPQTLEDSFAALRGAFG